MSSYARKSGAFATNFTKKRKPRRRKNPGPGLGQHRFCDQQLLIIHGIVDTDLDLTLTITWASPTPDLIPYLTFNGVDLPDPVDVEVEVDPPTDPPTFEMVSTINATHVILAADLVPGVDVGGELEGRNELQITAPDMYGFSMFVDAANRISRLKIYTGED